MQDKWQQSEIQAAKIYEGTKIPASGSQSDNKLDVQCGGSLADYRIENKFTEKPAYRLTLEDLIKSEKHALITGNKCFRRLDFNGKCYIVIKESWFKEIADAQKEDN